MIVDTVPTSDYLRIYEIFLENERKLYVEKLVTSLKSYHSRNDTWGDCEWYNKRTEKDTFIYVPFYDTIRLDIFKIADLQRYTIDKIYYYYDYKLNEMYSKLDKNEYVDFYMCNEFDGNRNDFYERVFDDGKWLRLYHFNTDFSGKYHFGAGGSVLFFNKDTLRIYLFPIGEDDGWVFPKEDVPPLKKFTDYEKWRFCSMLNDFRIRCVDTQMIIDKVLKNELSL